MTKHDIILQHYLSEWHLSNPQLLAQTPTSKVYTVTYAQGTVVLKILNPDETEEQVGALALHHFKGRGAVQLLHSDQGAHLLEYADGEDLTGLVKNGQDEVATAIIGDVVNALHANEAAPAEGITTLRRWFQALFSQSEQDRKNGRDTILLRAAAIAHKALDQACDARVLHGDIHHENIRQSSRGWLAFDPKGLYGERAYDLANTLCNPRPVFGVVVDDERRILRNSAILAQKCGLEPARVLLFLYLYACLSISWNQMGVATGGDAAMFLRIAEIAERNI